MLAVPRQFNNPHQLTYFKQIKTLKKKRENEEKEKNILTICCHANKDTFFEATFLALISCYFVYHTFSFIFTGIGWMEVFLNGSSEKSLSVINKYIGKHNYCVIFSNWFGRNVPMDAA